MANLYKRYVFWQLRVMSHIPGMRGWSRFLKRHYEAHFWRTTAISIGIATVEYTLVYWGLQAALQRAEQDLGRQIQADIEELLGSEEV